MATKLPKAKLQTEDNDRINTIMANNEAFLKAKTIEVFNKAVLEKIASNPITFNTDGSLQIGPDTLKTIKDNLGIPENYKIELNDTTKKQLLTAFEGNLKANWGKQPLANVTKQIWSKLQEIIDVPDDFKKQYSTQWQKLIVQDINKIDF